jgi:hypothetical protein
MSRHSARAVPRTAALVALGALAVHQLRYLAAYGGNADQELSRQGHGYLTQALPVLVALAVAALAACVLRAALAGAEGDEPSARRRALPYALAIVIVFASQETIEGALFAGHAAGLAAIFAGGAWLALPLALLCGWACALLDRGVQRLERIAARAGASLTPGPRADRVLGRPRRAAARPGSSSPLAFGLARRPPPALPR